MNAWEEQIEWTSISIIVVLPLEGKNGGGAYSLGSSMRAFKTHGDFTEAVEEGSHRSIFDGRSSSLFS